MVHTQIKSERRKENAAYAQYSRCYYCPHIQQHTKSQDHWFINMNILEGYIQAAVFTTVCKCTVQWCLNNNTAASVLSLPESNSRNTANSLTRKCVCSTHPTMFLSRRRLLSLRLRQTLRTSPLYLGN